MWTIFCGVWLALAMDRLVYLVALEVAKTWVGGR
jgi:hypothetical protein